MAFEFNDKKTLINPKAEAADLTGERGPLACGVRRLAEHVLPSNFAPKLFREAFGSKKSSPGRRTLHAGRVRSPARFILWIIIVCGIFSDLFASPKVTISVDDNSTIHIPYDPPNENKIKWDVTGASGEQAGPDIRLHEVKFQEYSLAGGVPELIAETPQCLYDRARQVIYSDAHLKVHAQEGRLFVEGDGFLMMQTNSSLVISNHAHSILQSLATSNAPASETEIFSESWKFRLQSETQPGIAIYQGNVRLADPQMKLACATLTADLPTNNAGEPSQIHHLLAETGVAIDFASPGSEPVHATGQKAVYENGSEGKLTNEWLELSGEPRAAISNGWMTADVFLMNRATGVLRGKKNVHLHYLAQSQTNAVSPANSALLASDIYADQFEYNTVSRLTRFWGGVRGYDPRINLRCEWLETTLPMSAAGTSNHLQRLVAETNVLIDFVDGSTKQTNHASGQKVIYHYAVAGGSTNETISLRGGPRVSLTNGWMTADEITSDRVQGWISGTGNQHSVFVKAPGEPPELDTQIFSDHAEFHNDSGVSIYEGRVRAYDPEMNLRGPRLTLRFAKSAAGTNRLENAVADGGVTIDFAGKAFASGDLTNFNAFTAKMKEPRRPIDEFVRSRLSQPTRDLLAGYPATTNPKLTNAVAEDLNRLVQSGAIYQPDRFSGIDFSDETKTLLDGQSKGADLMQLNRLLLLDAFRGEIFRSQKGDATRGTGEQAAYAHKISGGENDVVIELSGSPKLEKPKSTVTAEEKIVYDQAVGKVYLLGRGNLLTQMTGLSAKPLQGGNNQSKPKPR